MSLDETTGLQPPTGLADCIVFMLTHYDVWSATAWCPDPVEAA